MLAPTIGLTCVVNTISASKVYGELFPLFNGRPGIARNLYTVVFLYMRNSMLIGDLGKKAGRCFDHLIFDYLRLYDDSAADPKNAGSIRGKR